MGRIDDFRQVYAGVVTATAGTTDPRIRQAFATVPREDYLGPGPWHVMYYDGDYAETPSDDPAFLYHNLLVAIDRERALNNGEPWFLARMIDALAVKTGERVVHIGTGTGYYTGILAELAGTEGKVIGVEIDSELDALAPAGRLLLPLTARCRMGVVMKVTRCVSGFAACFVSQTGIFDCAGARDDRAGKRLADALDRGTWADVRSLRRDQHRRGPSCWLHGRGWCFSADPP